MSISLNNVSILIVDDHHIIRRTLRQWFSGKYPDLELFEANSGEDAMTFLAENAVDVVLMDVHLPGMDGIEATRLIKEATPEVRVIVLTVQEIDRYRNSASEAGADGYVIKRLMYTDLIPAISAVVAGREDPPPIPAVGESPS